MKTRFILGGALTTAIAIACSSTGGNKGGGFLGSSGSAGADAATAGTGGEAQGSGGSGTGGGFAIDAGLSDAPGGATSTCNSGPDEDKDQDGWSKNQGDCNDCDEAVNPGAIDVLNTEDGGATWGDEDCDGTPGSSAQTCDDTLTLDDLDPWNAAKAIELCKQTTATDKTFGVIDAKWVRADGAALGPGYNVGIQPGFGTNVNVQAGKNMLALSSGHARTPSQTNACGSQSCYTSGGGSPPPGFPQNSGSCTHSTVINDDVGLELTLRAPTNATGYRFKFRFYSFEYPEWVCSSYNDQFIALVLPPPAGSINGNISFDSQNNPVSVNVAFFDVCVPSQWSTCPAGTAELAGTGFDTWGSAGGTIWLQTQAPITGGETFTVRFAIWDTGDANLDSTTLIDAFEWIATGGTVDVGTDPVPVPQ